MGKIKRNKDKKKKEQKPIVHEVHEYKPSPGEYKFQAGGIVEITFVPDDLKDPKDKAHTLSEKKAKKLGFTIGSTHEIQNPEGLYRNTPFCVHLKGTDGRIYGVGFKFFFARGRDKKGNWINEHYEEKMKVNPGFEKKEESIKFDPNRIPIIKEKKKKDKKKKKHGKDKKKHK